MNGSLIQILVLAGIAVFLVIKLRNVLGTREGFEKPPLPAAAPDRRDLRVVDSSEDSGVDHDITDHAPLNSETADALAAMKKIQPEFTLSEFLGGARGAYEMILMGFENGDIAKLRPFLSDQVYASFEQVIDDRKARGEVIEASFVGLSGLELRSAAFDPATKFGEITVAFVGELTSVVKNDQGEVVAGNPTRIEKQHDTWTFGRVMGSADPNWQLIATGG